ncbi:MAG TPA: HAD family acid phosphatase [Rhizomicrobium sp.]|nr:HAD family acid phosphatase [Rhizomicrobium sp.]
MQFRYLAAASLGAALATTQPALAAALSYDCQAYITRVESVPPVAAADNDPWQCRAPTAKATTATHWFRNSLEYCRLVVNVYDEALRAARRIAASHPRRSWIVMLDADETVLDNSFFERERNLCGSEFKDAQWESWVRADMAHAVPGAAPFTQAVHRLGGLVAIVTNRQAADDPITQHTLRSAGIWFDSEAGIDDTADKTARWRRAEMELARKFGRQPRIALWIGDQVTDLAITGRGGAILRAMSQKDQGVGIGTTRFILPNPMYGNWMDNPAN